MKNLQRPAESRVEGALPPLREGRIAQYRSPE